MSIEHVAKLQNVKNDGIMYKIITVAQSIPSVTIPFIQPLLENV